MFFVVVGSMLLCYNNLNNNIVGQNMQADGMNFTMIQTIDLSGIWKFKLDSDKKGMEYGFPHGGFDDTIYLPGSTAQAKKGDRNTEYATGHLTEEYAFTGFAWFEKDIIIGTDLDSHPLSLFLERTRISRVWIDGNFIGTQNSLCTPHSYDLKANLSAGAHTLVVMIDNTDYPTRGGHMTSPDTQTNWNGITGAIELRINSPVYIVDAQLYPSISKQGVTIKTNFNNSTASIKNVSLLIKTNLLHADITDTIEPRLYDVSLPEGKSSLELFYPIETILCWDEFAPNTYQLEIITRELLEEDIWTGTFGFREFKAGKIKFHMNGYETFLRGKHDGMIFPLTGYAPTTLAGWLSVMTMAKNYGINHYRFHTCCPPDAAFMAADQLGIYMEPELPFWGTITDEGYPEHNKEEQDYLILEGTKILKEFGNHPSFVMMSLGNELWGSKMRISEILRNYKELDSRHLYTQGSNNFQFVPTILEEDDFYVGVRFDKERLFRGSYAMCDAPLGHVQTMEPNTLIDYDEQIQPSFRTNSTIKEQEETIAIQFHDHTVEVQATSQSEVLLPNIPVISHEIGQYETYPNFNEIAKYTGVLKARNFEIFKQRLEDKGLGDLADQYFRATGRLAVSCYKEELEAAFRSQQLAGFQLLDLQDFSGQGTALVGVLDAFMEEKGIVTQEEWQSFCSDAVLLGRFAKYNYVTGENFTAIIELSYYRSIPLLSTSLSWEIERANDQSFEIYASGSLTLPTKIANGLTAIGNISIRLPNVEVPTNLKLTLTIDGSTIKKEYFYWVYPRTEVNLLQHDNGYCIYQSELGLKKVYVLHTFDQIAKDLLTKGENVLLLPTRINNGLPGFYCTDFWCYPMFRSISESVNKQVPVGTMGLLINKSHKALQLFPSEIYSTPQWYQIVTNSTAAILDETSPEFRPIVQVIDNFERNHKLGLLFEAKVSFDTNNSKGNLLVCTSHLEDLLAHPEAALFFYSILEYAGSKDFNPIHTLKAEFFETM